MSKNVLVQKLNKMLTNRVFILTVDHFSTTQLKNVSSRKVAFLDRGDLFKFVEDHRKENKTNFGFIDNTNSSIINVEKSMIIQYTSEEINFNEQISVNTINK